jgi:arabinogalactan oligomer/maltooligosaccharide transport system permease protein
VLDLDQAATALKDVGFTLAVIIVAVVILELLLYVVVVRWRRSKWSLPIMLLTPAVIGLLLLYVYPLLYELNLSFTKMSLRYFVEPGFLGLDTEKGSIFVGFQNYVDVLDPGKYVLPQTNFYQLFAQTIIWTVINVFLHVVFGVLLALLMNRKLRGRTIYRALLILPWAIPAVASLQIWRTEYNYQYGAVNQILNLFGLPSVQWMSDPIWNFVAMIITNVWLGVPFMMVITLGALQSISQDYYEAAELDGANGPQQFRSITVPLIKPILVPAILLGVFLTFNNILVPFFINEQYLTTSDILVTALYRAAFQYSRFGYAAAFAFVIFAILLVFTVFYVRRTKVLKGVLES